MLLITPLRFEGATPDHAARYKAVSSFVSPVSFYRGGEGKGASVQPPGLLADRAPSWLRLRRTEVESRPQRGESSDHPVTQRRFK